MKWLKIKRILALTLISTLLSGTISIAAEIAPPEAPKPKMKQETEDKVVIEETVEEDLEIEETESLETEPVTEEDVPDVITQELIDKYTLWMQQAKRERAVVGTYETELAKFPADYQTKLKDLHKKHPEWVFVAVDTGLNWDDVVAGEASNDRSLLTNSNGDILLSKASGDYNTSTGAYIPKDGKVWVTASKPAVAYYVDPRNFLNEKFIFAFEALDFNKDYHKLQGVENVLAGTDLANKQIKYLNTSGKTVSVSMTYGEAIFNAGKDTGVSPVFLAAKIKQETGARLTNGSISGNYSSGGVSYRGYYNYYNIGANATAEGSAIAKGLTYAQGGKNGDTSYSRPWKSPVLAIKGGAQFLASSYISKGQNTTFFQKFNTVYSPYYNHQYMQNLTAAASEGASTYGSYDDLGVLDDAFVFYIPVYKNMPKQDTEVTIDKTVKTAVTTSDVNVRKEPSTDAEAVAKLPEGTSVTVSGGYHSKETLSVSKQLSNPYWVKVKSDSYSGYISLEYLEMDSNSSISVGKTKQLNVEGVPAGEKIYYETTDPAIAKVSSSGKITAVKAGRCMIYAVSGSGKTMDMIGITVKKTDSEIGKPELVSAKYSDGAVTVKWEEVSGVDGYYVYRKKEGGSFSKIGTVSKQSTVSYKDKTAEKGNTYYYTVKAYEGTTISSYDTTGIKVEMPDKTYTKYKTTTVVYYRSGAGTSYDKKGSLSKGKTIEVEDGYSKSANGYTWYRFKLDGKTYYVVSKYLEKVTSSSSSSSKTYTKYKTTSEVNYRSGPGTSYDKKGTLTKGKTIEVEDGYSKSANGYTWYRFKLDGKTYYVTSKYLKKATSSSSTSSKTYTKYKTTSEVNYRSGPGTSYDKKGTLAKGKTIEVEDGYSKSANGYTWYRFKLDGKTHYVTSKYLKKA